MLIFRPAGTLVLDRNAGVLRHTTGWLGRGVAEFPLKGLRAATVQDDTGGSLHRLVLVYADGSSKPLTDSYSYGAKHHQEVARALTAVLSVNV